LAIDNLGRREIIGAESTVSCAPEVKAPPAGQEEEYICGH
jgi:hypothetical protein